MEDNEILEKEFLKIREDFKFFENNKDIIYLDDRFTLEVQHLKSP